MDTFSIIRDAIAASEGDTSKSGLRADVVEAGRIVDAVQTVVNALTPPEGGRYVVGFADISTAATSIAERRIVVSSKPLRDLSLSMVEKAVVIATFAAHEIGHTLVTAPRKGRIAAHNDKSGYHAVANLADDIILEPHMTDRYPILADAFEFTGLWVLRNTAKELPKVHRMRKDMTTAERFNVVLSATRYGDITDIVWADATTAAERDWCRAWRDRLIALRLTDHDGFLATCDELWERIRSEAPEEEQPDEQPPPIIDEPEGNPGQDEDGDDESDDGEDDGPGGEDEGEGNPQPTDEDGEGEESFEQDENPDFDDATDDGGEGEGEDESDGTDEGVGVKSEIADDSDAASESKGEGDDGEMADDAESDGDHGDDDEGEGGSGNPDLRNEDDFDKDEVETSMHDQSERPAYDYEADRADEQVRQFANTTSTAFGAYGRLSTEWS